MNNAEAKKVIERQINWIEGLYHPYNKPLNPESSDGEKVAAYSHCLTLLEKLEQKGGVLPEMKELISIGYKFYDKMTTANKDIAADFLAQAIRQQIALNLVRFEERLLPIIQAIRSQKPDGRRVFSPTCYFMSEDSCIKAISAELRGKRICSR